MGAVLVEIEKKVKSYGYSVGGVSRRESVFKGSGTGHADSVEGWGKRSRKTYKIFKHSGEEDSRCKNMNNSRDINCKLAGINY